MSVLEAPSLWYFVTAPQAEEYINQEMKGHMTRNEAQ